MMKMPPTSLGFNPTNDMIVAAVHSELRIYDEYGSKMAMKLWGWDQDTLTDVERYRLSQLRRMFDFQQQQILSALRRLNYEWKFYVSSDEKVERQAAEFIDELPRRTYEALRERFVQGHDINYAPRYAFPGFPTWRSGDLEGPEKYVPEEYSQHEFQTAIEGVMSWRHPAVARNTGPSKSLAMGGRIFDGVDYWRLTDGSYPREYVKDARLYDLIDTALAIQAEYQLQCLLTDREFTRVIETRGTEFEWLKAEAARKAAEEKAGGFWGLFGDILGIVSAVAGVLALIPILTPIAGPVAAVTAIAALGAHTVDAAIKGDWDAATIAGLGADALAALPGIGAVAKSMKAGKAVTKTFGIGAKAATKTRVAVRRAGLTFLAETGGVEASNATKVFDYIGTKGAKALGATEKAGKLTSKVLQGSVNLSTQVPLVVEMASGTDMTEEKKAATGAALTANYGQTIGSWGAVGTATQKAGTVSLAAFARIIGRR